jgi:alkylation response protein AidB-like acyl-CoA dehydrogenase
MIASRVMNFDDAPADAAFRAELRAWLAANHPGELPDDLDAAFDLRRAWQARMAASGWGAPSWPPEWGGRGASVAQQIVFQEEMALARVPPIANAIAVWNIGPALLQYGTEEQKQRWLPPMLRADAIWCQGFSEPDAGSDLAAVGTRAVRDGDAYVVNGRKIWISYGSKADRCFLLCRTGSAEDRHRGLTILVVDVRAPGVTVSPLRDITGDAAFSEVLFEDVRVPVSDRVGDEGDGWRVAMSTLTHERIGTVTYGIQLRQKLETLLRHREVDGALTAQETGALWCNVELIRLTALRAVTKAGRGEEPVPEVPIGKLLWSVVAQQLADTATHAFGLDGLLWRGDAGAPDGGRWAYDEVWSRMTTIGAGTTEIQKTILAERALGMPRG